jgi:hypothetical protein
MEKDNKNIYFIEWLTNYKSDPKYLDDSITLQEEDTKIPNW